MKLIYQHLLSFLLIIVTTVSIIGYAEIKSVTAQSYEQNYRRMDDYASSLGDLAANDQKNGTIMLNSEFLDQLQFVLRGDDLHLHIFNNQGMQIYPKSRHLLRLKGNVFAVLSHGEEIHIRNNNEEKSYLCHTKNAYTGVIVPWMSGHKIVGAIWLGSLVKDVERPIDTAKRNLINALIIALFVGLIMSTILSYYSTNKINRLSRAIKKVRSGNFDVQIEQKGNDEIDQLAASFNKMVQALKEYNQEVKSQEKRRDQFMADAAHEMRTPLTTINGILEGLQYNAIPEESKPKSIDLMRRETKRLIRLVNENLDYEKIRNNQINLSKTQFNASKVLEDVIIQLKQNADKVNDQLEIEVPSELPIYADRDRLTQIIVNLVQNAIQFTTNGHILLSGRRIIHGTEITVKDDGIGMNKEQMKYIFERFFKADPSRARLGTGESGLGLAIVSSLVKQHGGKVSVTSEMGQGAQFTIKIYDQGYEQYLTE
ncbi:HAMP domain-containing sensor histidine kinase [Lactobacillus sp. ESL0679]|uniref:sensor histidine kinase n=1 Tax=Lactobacillus sp. ESL0679 TaxID=2983209 RepID=UPI0023F7D675|nr:HAMP domain-containing sensor histidine kinase [Lactobacillus sp. ESL0679]MDF7683471.1 HAMP domain-containing sensor histidine kinase [Lactobacillus sp. ESL0679]